jgi:hypothetical protein
LTFSPQIPLIGSASHRLNLLVQKLWAKGGKYYDITQKIHTLHVALRTLKNAYKLAAKTPLTPHLDQETRWSSMFKMIRSNKEINDILPTCAFDFATRRLFLTELEKEEADELLEFLKKIESVSKEIQRDDPIRNNLYSVRLLFDRLIRDFPDEDLESGIGKDAAIVHDKHFENAIVKLQGPNEARLSPQEKEAIKVFKVDVTNADEEDIEDMQDEGYAARILREDAARTQKKQKRTDYRSVAHVSSHNNRCERLFSGTKLVMTDQRKCMDPSTLEMRTAIFGMQAMCKK